MGTGCLYAQALGVYGYAAVPRVGLIKYKNKQAP
jgi:hypothetical protein